MDWNYSSIRQELHCKFFFILTGEGGQETRQERGQEEDKEKNPEKSSSSLLGGTATGI